MSKTAEITAPAVASSSEAGTTRTRARTNESSWRVIRSAVAVTSSAFRGSVKASTARVIAARPAEVGRGVEVPLVVLRRRRGGEVHQLEVDAGARAADSGVVHGLLVGDQLCGDAEGRILFVAHDLPLGSVPTRAGTAAPSLTSAA